MPAFLTWLQNEQTAIYAKMALCVLIVAVAWRVRRRMRLGGRGHLKNSSRVLAVAGLVGVGAYFWFGKFRQDSYVNYYDVFNYYLGSKYHTELGYSTLYSAVALADLEGGQVFRISPYIRNLENLRKIGRASVAADAPRILDSFSAKRWHEFKQDVQWFGKRAFAKAKILVDMGHNGTPFWTAWAGELFNRLPPRSETVILLLSCVDLILLAVFFAMVAWLVGWVPMWMTLILFTTNYALHTWTIKGCLFRFDWLVALGLAVCLLHRKWYGWAGAMMAYAVLVRIFPLFFLFGFGVKTVQAILCRREFPNLHRRFWGSFALTIGLLAGGSVIHAGGFEQWRGFLNKIDEHASHIAPKREGVMYAGFLKPHVGLDDVVNRARSWTHGYAKWVIAGAAVLAAVAAALRLKDDETPLLGGFLLFFLVNATWYYYCTLLVCYLVLSMRLERWGNMAGIWLMALLAFASYVIHQIHRPDLARHTSISTMMLVVIPLMVLFLYMSARKERDSTTAGSPDTCPQNGPMVLGPGDPSGGSIR